MKKIILLIFVAYSSILANTLYEQAMEYQKNEQFNEAIRNYKKIIAQEPNNFSILFNLGHCYLSIGKGKKAINAFQKILTILPGATPAEYNSAYTHKTIGLLDEAIELYQNIIKKNDNYEPAELALGFAYLTKGDFKNGWKQHERYLKKSGKNGDQLRSLLQTNMIAGTTILLTPEGGLGDSLQFIRYAHRLQNMGAYIIVSIQKPLIPLLSRCPYINKLIPSTNTVPEHDARATLMSLPAIFADTEQTLPNTTPYLYANQSLIEKWQSTLAHDTNYKIGICWQADVKNDVSRLPIARRGCPLSNFISLQNIPHLSFYSLQKYDGIEEIFSLPTDFPLHHFTDLDETTGPFEDTAALMKNLDLIITVDTAIAHLAGALGCKVWLLLPYATDWRWIYNRTDSPWYPTMKIFKQTTPFDWQEVMQHVHNELRSIIQQ